jgi:hypothetical protein
MPPPLRLDPRSEWPDPFAASWSAKRQASHLPRLAKVAKAPATLPWLPVFVRTYGDRSKMTPWGRDSSCGAGNIL